MVDAETGLLVGHATAPATVVEPRPEDPLRAVLHRIVAADIAAMRETAAQLDLPTLARAARMLARARRVDICGTGDSALVGAQLQACLHGLGVAIGLFALERLVGRIVLVRWLGRERRTARLSHMGVAAFLLAVGYAYLRLVPWLSGLLG